MQISEGTCTVTQDSVTVIAANGVDWTDVQVALGYGLPVFFSLIGSSEIPWQVSNALSPNESGSGFWELTLVVPWPNETQAGALYTIHKDFTANYYLPLPSPGDYQGAQLHARAYNILDAALNAQKIQRVKLAADLTGISSSTLEDVTGIAFALLAGVHYRFVFELLYQVATATTTGLKIGLSIPTSPDVFCARVTICGRAAASGDGNAVYDGVLTGSDLSVTADQVAAIDTTYPAYIEGSIIPSAGNPGNLQLQWASEGTNIVTPKAGSNGSLWFA